MDLSNLLSIVIIAPWIYQHVSDDMMLDPLTIMATDATIYWHVTINVLKGPEVICVANFNDFTLRSCHWRGFAGRSPSKNWGRVVGEALCSRQYFTCFLQRLHILYSEQAIAVRGFSYLSSTKGWIVGNEAQSPYNYAWIISNCLPHPEDIIICHNSTISS